MKGNSMSTSKRANGWTPWTVATILTMPMLGCTSVSSPNAICDGTVTLRNQHADALLEDGGDQSLQTGAALIGAIDAGCLVSDQ